MKSLLNIVFNVIGLLLFAMLVMGGVDVFDMIFSLADRVGRNRYCAAWNEFRGDERFVT